MWERSREDKRIWRKGGREREKGRKREREREEGSASEFFFGRGCDIKGIDQWKREDENKKKTDFESIKLDTRGKIP